MGKKTPKTSGEVAYAVGHSRSQLERADSPSTSQLQNSLRLNFHAGQSLVVQELQPPPAPQPQAMLQQ